MAKRKAEKNGPAVKRAVLKRVALKRVAVKRAVLKRVAVKRVAVKRVICAEGVAHHFHMWGRRIMPVQERSPVEIIMPIIVKYTLGPNRLTLQWKDHNTCSVAVKKEIEIEIESKRNLHKKVEILEILHRL
jgi:hypothetical protein